MRTRRASAMLMATLAAALLATAAGLLILDTRAARAASSEGLRIARAEQRTLSLLAFAIVRLDSDDSLAGQGVLFAEEDGARVLRQDAAGLVDVNTATPELMARLLARLGASHEEAVMLADRVADWRDEDDFRRVQGAEAADYARASLPPPANRPFEAEGELISVMGMNSALLHCLSPYLTTYSGLDGVDFGRAPTALKVLLDAPPEATTALGLLAGSVVLLTAEAPISQHAVVRRSIWLRLTRDPARPFMIHRAAQQLASMESPEQSCGATVS